MQPFDALGSVAVVDCETTGRDAEKDRIVSLAVVLVDLTAVKRKGRHEIEALVEREYKVVVNPGVSIPASATRIHGIRDTDVSDLENFGGIAQQLIDFIADRPLVGFNVSFDKRFLNAELKRYGFKSFHNKRSYCVQKALQRVWGYRPSLPNAMARMSIKPFTTEIHDPLDDAVATASIAVVLHRVNPSYVKSLPGDRWSGVEDKTPTRKQLDYIHDLGGDPSRVKTMRQASEVIDRLKSGQPQHSGCLGSVALVLLILLVLVGIPSIM